MSLEELDVDGDGKVDKEDFIKAGGTAEQFDAICAANGEATRIYKIRKHEGPHDRVKLTVARTTLVVTSNHQSIGIL